VTHGRGRGEASHAPEHGCDGGGACGGGGSRVCGGGERIRGPARANPGGGGRIERPGRAGRIGRQAGERIELGSRGGGKEGGARRHERMKTEHALRFGLPPFNLGWIGSGLEGAVTFAWPDKVWTVIAQ
jgi:hypothetical protein